jgi:plastocyanin
MHGILQQSGSKNGPGAAYTVSRRVLLMQGRRVSPSAAAAAALCLAACGGSPSTPTPPANPTATTTITITASGVSPKDILVSPGARVTVTNNDTRAHNFSSNPHPEHTDCTEINQVGLLTPGQSRQTGNLNTVRVCGFHDHDLPNVENLNGTITIR